MNYASEKHKPSLNQQKVIRFIYDMLQIDFKGENSKDAFEFIGKYKNKAEKVYRNYDYEGASKWERNTNNRNFIRISDGGNSWSDRIEEMGYTADMYDVPNH